MDRCAQFAARAENPSELKSMTINYLELLDAIERREMLSLSWGYVDGSMSRSEVLGLLPDAPEDVDVESLLDALIDRCLVIEIRHRRIRSRFAESVRLLARTRQLFYGRPWQGAPRLVSDFRVDLRRRRYPMRNRTASQIRLTHKQVIGERGMRWEAWQALAERPALVLAGFQERATIRLLGSKPDTGTIVTAGTGSGKTLAFYLPTLIRIAEQVERNASWVKCLAIYPRIELLKDQLAEAFKQARGLDATLMEKNRRPIRVGAYFGSTPTRATVADLKPKWPPRGGSFICPWLRCPACDADLIWKAEDLQRKTERLICTTSTCDSVITGDQLALTRESLVAAPPDILFTTTEMLNQRMSDLRYRSLFGIGQPVGRRPLFALLDEVHTYVGTSGAQSALVLRRWRHMLDAPVVWCGLSATLQEAPRFFADLVGLGVDQVAEVTPTAQEMTEEGAEYQVVVRGDALLEASLLSTTIQASMLLARMMDPVTQPSEGAFGRRLFVFTDNLDVINRLYNNLQDSEGYTIFGRADPGRLPLAALRAGGSDDDLRRDLDGQRWRACEKLGRDLSDRLLVGRTSSQDPGVLAGADIIVATPSLEVGYNDDQVGAVIQHKAPRNMASFLQRKGRAGRQRKMRPFTVTVLSDYGRDKIAFQTYEHLFDPVLPPQHLPVKNEYVLRMQAVFALLDWLSLQAHDAASSGWMWDLLSRPDSVTNGAVKQKVEAALQSLAKGEPAALKSLRKHLRQALQIPNETVETILWDPPRALLLEAVPTLVRRYFRQWQLVQPQGSVLTDMQVGWHPLPDFIPRNLFSDLSLPEVQVHIPAATVNHEARHESMPIVQALQQLAPGRVTRRFAFERGGLYHWAAISVEHNECRLKVDEYALQNEYLGEFEGLDQHGNKQLYPVFRPWAVALTIPDTKEVLPTSNAMPRWMSAWTPHGIPLTVGVSSKSAWYECVTAVRFHLHRFRSSVVVQRFTHQVDATIRQHSGDRLVEVQFTDANDRPAAVGFEIEVDGFYVDVRIPPAHQLAESVLPAALGHSSRAAYLRYRLLNAPELPKEVNVLQREWMFQIFLCAVVNQAVQRDLPLSQAASQLLAGPGPLRAFTDVLRSLFVLQEYEAVPVDSEDEDVEDDNSSQRMSRLEERLTDSLGRADVLATLASLAEEFDRPDPQAYGTWLRATIHETLGEALLQACINTAPRHAALDTLLVDIDTDRPDHTARIWITESTLGGAGVIQAFAEAFTSEPRALYRAVEAAIAPSDLEMASYGLSQFIDLVTTDSEIESLTGQLRSSQGHVESKQLRDRLYRLLSARGVELSHGFSVSLNARLLRPGSTSMVDQLLAKLTRHWEALEHRFGVAIGLREFCCIAVNNRGLRDEIVGAFGELPGTVPQDADIIAVLSGLLWPKGIEIRQRTLQSYNPFRQRRLSDPALIRHLLLDPNLAVIQLTELDDEWYLQFAQAIAQHGIVQLAAPRRANRRLRTAIVRIVSTAVDVGFLQFFPYIERIEKDENEMRVVFTIREQT
ncbi:DEAD/DEAH box helicase [Janthinobacterium lividum]|uniref:protein DpdJ n=1 Tax=Janthinobacterium lividum TaxID=29581 RepID=UPI001595D5D6|nr:protein DpdJ [Janthinobacterium lividum]QKY02431.1 DEAD/DEAH box helicase [Janthinobacterium lividum]